MNNYNEPLPVNKFNFSIRNPANTGSGKREMGKGRWEMEVLISCFSPPCNDKLLNYKQKGRAYLFEIEKQILNQMNPKVLSKMEIQDFCMKEINHRWDSGNMI